MIPHSIAGIGQIADQYDCFVLDQFGVLHDGQAPYPGAIEALERLSQAGKTVLLLSNSGKRSGPNEARLVRLGFKPGSWAHFLSSGEIAWRDLARSLDPGERKKCLLIARDGDKSAVNGLPLDLTDKGAEADVVLLSASEGDRYDLGFYRDLLAPAARRDIECICTNPDKIMLTADGPRFGAGRIAMLYEELGGPVRWIGKPFPAIYAAAMDLLGNPDPSRVVCVGDSIEHDIVGGAQAGLSTVLVTTGVLADLDDAVREALFTGHGVQPDYLTPSFVWGG